MDADTPEALLVRWRTHRHLEALGELLKAHRHQAYSVALRVTGNPSDAEDAVQDAMLKLMSRSHGLEDMAAFRNSVYRATIQCALDLLRKRRRRDANESGERESIQHAPAVEEKSLADRETAALLSRAVAELADDERVPVSLCFYEGLSVVEAARTLELPRETVRARLARALATLRARLRLNGRDASAAIIITTLWKSPGNAPLTLDARLDAALPGRPCSEVPNAQKRPALEPSHVLRSSAGLWKVAAAAATASVVALGAWATYGPRISIFEGGNLVPLAGSEPAVPVAEVRKVTAQDESTFHKPENNEKETDMKLVHAVTLAGAALLPVVASAADPKPEVAAILEKIESRKAEKEAATARQTARWVRDANQNPRSMNTQSENVAPGAANGIANPRPANPQRAQ
ncbi:MAG TPA: sigma-70 family RNA polymerase sigma factor [Planctomycetota bacterium]|nr:sigma-70 family RNA polymerase sigma factor [Planctomycetota bacterium]